MISFLLSNFLVGQYLLRHSSKVGLVAVAFGFFNAKAIRFG